MYIIVIIYFRFQMKHCDDLGIPADKSSTLFLFLGLFAATGRLVAGFLCDITCINSQFLYQAAVLVCGASTMLLTVAKTYSSLAAVVVMFSVADGLMVSTFIIELFKSVKESQRASCLGFCMLMAGVFVFCGPPVSGECLRVCAHACMGRGTWGLNFPLQSPYPLHPIKTDQLLV